MSWRPASLLVALALLVYSMLLQPGHAPNSHSSDFVPYGWPTKQILYDSLHAGNGLPSWRSDQLSGSVALTQPQALYTYPLDFLYWVVPPLWAMGPTLWIHLLLAGVVQAAPESESSPLDLNRATAAQLESLPGLGAV